MKVIKYCWSFQEAIENGPHILEWINSKTPKLLLAPIFLTFVYFPLVYSMHIFKSEKLRESRIPFDTSLWILCLEICSKHLCQNMEEFSPVNLCFVQQLLACKDSLICETLISNLYRLSTKEPIPIIFECWKRLTFPFPNKQEWPHLSKWETNTKFHLNDDT